MWWPFRRKQRTPPAPIPSQSSDVMARLEEAIDQLRAANSTIEEAMRQYWGNERDDRR